MSVCRVSGRDNSTTKHAREATHVRARLVFVVKLVYAVARSTSSRASWSAQTTRFCPLVRWALSTPSLANLEYCRWVGATARCCAELVMRVWLGHPPTCSSWSDARSVIARHYGAHLGSDFARCTMHNPSNVRYSVSTERPGPVVVPQPPAPQRSTKAPKPPKPRKVEKRQKGRKG